MPAKPGPLQPHEQRNYGRREPEEPPPGQPKLGDSFLILTEGKVTERTYFESLRETLEVKPVTVRILHPSCTDAEGLVRAAIKERDTLSERRSRGNAELGCYDHIWVLFDTDVPARQEQLDPALALAEREGIHVGHSTPGVEVWLLLHFRDRPGPLLKSEAATHAVSKAWGQPYDKSEGTFRKLWPALKPNIRAAVNRSIQIREYHEKAGSSSPADPSTQLDLLVRALDASVPPPLRILSWK